jgi:replicative DNA helicase
VPIADDRDPRNDNPQDYPQLPNSIDLEQTVLGTVLLDNRAYEAIAERVTAERFFDPTHARLWEIISRTITAGTLASPVTIAPVVKDWPSIAPDLTVGQYLGRLAGAAMPPNRIRDYAKSLTDLATRRQIISVAQDAIARAMDTDTEADADKIVEQTEQDLYAITQRRTEGREISIGQASQQALEQISAAYERGGQLAGLQTGLLDLDIKMGGLQNSDLIILGGRPGSGKTSLATTIAANISRERGGDNGDSVLGWHVHFFSQEMSVGAARLRRISSGRWLNTPLASRHPT